MDPDTTLNLIRDSVAEYHLCNRDLNPEGCQEALIAVFCAFQDLDEWLSRGGFLPDAWNPRGKLMCDNTHLAE
jgi:hypothetical protein